MEVNAEAGDITTLEAGALIVNLFEGIKQPGGATGAVDAALDGAIANLIKDGEIKGKKGELTLIHTLGKMPAARVIVAGLGKQEDFSRHVVRSVAAESARLVRRLGIRKAATIAHGAGIGGMDPGESGQAIAEGAYLGLYTFRRYKTNGDKGPELEELAVVEKDGGKIAGLQAGIDKGRILADSANIARDLGNEPANILTPTEMAERAGEMANAAGLEFTALDRPQIEELGMGALLAVAAGSNRPPRFIIMQYKGDPSNESNNIALCGKGITFDSGGISIKPAEGMGAMKGDMAGGAAVIGAMNAIARLKPKINVMAVVPATENMSGGSAIHPGDVVRTMAGKTFEIISTDAEGRMVLADAVAYVKQHDQRRIVDVATLTGAATIALGNDVSIVMGNDQGLVDGIIKSGETTGERFWQLPMLEEHRDLIKSDIADMKNSGGRPAGSITAGYFIREFAGDTPWAHLDIAGTARTDKERGHIVKGHTGIPVRMLVHLVLGLAENSG
jgi:leucyl aminopeptidase